MLKFTPTISLPVPTPPQLQQVPLLYFTYIYKYINHIHPPLSPPFTIPLLPGAHPEQDLFYNSIIFSAHSGVKCFNKIIHDETEEIFHKFGTSEKISYL
jgi:hypothetical protein